MRTPDEISAVMSLHKQGWGAKRIARELGMSSNTVRRYVAQGGWKGYRKPRRKKLLEGQEELVKELFAQHHGNAEVVRQELKSQHGVMVSLRTVERVVAPQRQALKAQARATVRFETAPGKQLQIYFGEKRVHIGGDVVTVHVFVATLGYSRRNFVMAFEHERQSAWFTGLEGAFWHFGGVPEEVLVDNPRTLVNHHDMETREVVFNERFHAFCRYWGVRARACALSRARTKGKDENGVGYVKKNALAGREFATWSALEGHLQHWMREVADVRVHGTTGEQPLARFEKTEAKALRPMEQRAPFLQVRELGRKVQSDACVEVDTNRYSVPWRWIGEEMRVVVADGEVRIYHGKEELAVHPQQEGRRQSRVDKAHLAGIVGAGSKHDDQGKQAKSIEPVAPPAVPELLRPLEEYEAALGGGW